jgi:hypothetical protein
MTFVYSAVSSLVSHVNMGILSPYAAAVGLGFVGCWCIVFLNRDARASITPGF